MKLTVLDDNHTYIDQYYLGEPAFSVLIEDGDQTILFDTGYSDVVLRNAEKMGIDLKKLDKIILSHGHIDHAQGLKYLADAVDLTNVELIAGPGTFDPKHLDGRYLGAPFTLSEISRLMKVTLTDRPLQISEHVTYAGRIPRTIPFETVRPVGTVIRDGLEKPDDLAEESALYLDTADGIFVLTGCSHCGICNIVDHAQSVTGCPDVAGILGGFHLFRTGERLDRTIEYFMNRRVQELYPCHCVNFKCKAAIHAVKPIHEVGVGMSLTLEDGETGHNAGQSKHDMNQGGVHD